MNKASLLAATAVVALAAAGAARADDDIMAAAKARVAAAVQRAGAWDGPTTGPTASPGKTIVYLGGDLRNGGTSGVADGVKEATGRSAGSSWSSTARARFRLAPRPSTRLSP
jgi:ribose transport system substrate-binding protein